LKALFCFVINPLIGAFTEINYRAMVYSTFSLSLDQ